MEINPIRLEIFRHLFAAVADEMGIILGRSAYSPNIKERKDFSCAVFDTQGQMIAQAAHIPVHLGSMPLSVQIALAQMEAFQPGDIAVLNDPYRGGTHLPDVTIIQPVFLDKWLAFFVANRAHHSDIGGMSPGSMPLATELFQEGIIIPPLKLQERGRLNQAVWDLLLANVRTPAERKGDFMAQINACHSAEKRLVEMAERYGLSLLEDYAKALLDYAEQLMRQKIEALPDGLYSFVDFLDDDGFSEEPIKIALTLEISGNRARVDFTGSSPQVQGSINAVYAVTLSAVRYCFRCLLDVNAPTNDGLFRPLEVIAPEGTVINAKFPAAVSGGNVETSQRIVDAVLGALAQAAPARIPAASSGTMNNLTFGGYHKERPFSFYETIGGGAGACPSADGASGIHTHMTNTMNTPVEAMELEFPIRVEQYRLRRHSGGAGRYRGGDGIVRAIRFLIDLQVGLISDRRRFRPYGLHGGDQGKAGENKLLKADGSQIKLPGKFNLRVQRGDILQIETPGGGGWGAYKLTTENTESTEKEIKKTLCSL